MPFDFRLPEPHGAHSTPTPPTNPPELVHPPENATESGWLRNIDLERDGATLMPHYSGGGGAPWSAIEMALVRDLIVREQVGHGSDSNPHSRCAVLACCQSSCATQTLTLATRSWPGANRLVRLKPSLSWRGSGLSPIVLCGFPRVTAAHERGAPRTIVTARHLRSPTERQGTGRTTANICMLNYRQTARRLRPERGEWRQTAQLACTGVVARPSGQGRQGGALLSVK